MQIQKLGWDKHKESVVIVSTLKLWHNAVKRLWCSCTITKKKKKIYTSTLPAPTTKPFLPEKVVLFLNKHTIPIWILNNFLQKAFQKMIHIMMKMLNMKFERITTAIRPGGEKRLQNYT